ncbi:MAG: hypothetical protein ACI31M_00945, partial [Bacilli bacterium]
FKMNNNYVEQQYNEEQQILIEDDYREEVTQLTDNIYISQNNLQGITQIAIGFMMIGVATSILIFILKCWIFSKIFKRVK